jgi:diketogulonate reductase-like aldo/keto reductase
MDPRRRALLALVAAGALRPSLARDGIMSKRIPATGEALPVIGVGTWQTFDVGNDPSARAPLREVLKLLDGNLIDSSPMYGSSEAVAGDLIAELGIRDKLFVATKVWTNGREAGIAQMETSFRRLRVKRMDLMQVHNLADLATHTKTLLEMKQNGQVRYIGITHYTSSAYAEIERLLKTRRYDFLQIN